MLTQNRTNRLRAPSATLVAALVSLPLVVAFAADPGQTSKAAPAGQQTAGAQGAIIHGRVTDEAGPPLADVRVRGTVVAPDGRIVDAITHQQQSEAKSDANGNYRLELAGITKPTHIMIDAVKPGYRGLRGPLMFRGDAKFIHLAPGTVEEAPLMLRTALYFAGIVVDEQARPMSVPPAAPARSRGP